MPVVDAKGLCKAYGTRQLLSDVNVTVRRGERVGVVGLNGAGKSTLARILAGLEAPDSGEVTRRRGSSVRYLAQSPELAPELTALQLVTSGLSAWHQAVKDYENLSQRLVASAAPSPSDLAEQARLAEEVERLGGWDQSHKARSMLEQLGVLQVESPVGKLSGGERRRVALAEVLVAAPSLAILDEPTNHLDAETVEWLEHYLSAEFAGALLLVTHDRYLLNRVAQRTLEVAQGQVYSYQGGYEAYLEQKAERQAHAQRTEQNRQNFLRTELDWLRRQPKARGTKQKARIERAETALGKRAPRAEKAFAFEAEVVRQGKTILELSALKLKVGQTTLIESLDLTLAQGDRIGIIGKNGTGKTTLLRAILGECETQGGQIKLGQTVKIAYFDQERSDLDSDASVFDNIIGDQTQIELGGKLVDPYSYLERFGFGSREHRQLVGSLSGGERARVALARLLRRPANLIVLDEPTNDLDVASLSALENLLLEFSLTALVVTHDRWFLDRVANSILAFEGAGRVVRYAGNYQALSSARRQNPQASANTNPAATQRARTRKPKAGLTWSEARELDGLLERIEQAEARVQSLSEELSAPETYQRPAAEVTKLSEALAEARANVESLTLRWEELETKKAAEDSH